MNFLQFIDSDTSISEPILGSYDAGLVLLSLSMASLASYVAFYVSEKLSEEGLGNSKQLWFVVGSVILGLGVWAMHFIAMLAFKLPVEVSYNLWITALSVVPAILAGVVVLQSTNQRELSRLLLARNALLMGSGIGVMHYTGMSAMEGEAIMRYSFPLFCVSIVVAVLLAYFTLKLKLWAERGERASSYFDWRLLGVSLTMGVTISAMHYTGMAATFFYINEAQVISAPEGLSPQLLAWFIGIIGINIFFVLLMVHRVSDHATIKDLESARNIALVANQQLRDAQLQLVQSAKLASIGQICAGLAHEINQPLGTIRLNAQFILKMYCDQRIEEELVTANSTRIITQVDKVTKIINHLKIFSRESKHESEMVDINSIINETFVLLGDSMKRHNIKVDLQLADDLPMIKCDFIRVEQVLANLITNARDAVKGDYEKRISLRSYQQDDMVCVDVVDTGCGIAASVLSKIFDPFFTTKPVGEGTGLGMSISLGIIQDHKGKLSVTSNEGEGSCFTMALPQTP